MPYIEIGSAPCEESCAQVGTDDYAKRAKAECRRFIDRIRQVLGPEPSGAGLTIKSFPHDFGTYYEVVCRYDDSVPEAIEYAYRCEAEAPTKWDDESLPPADGRCPVCGDTREMESNGSWPACPGCGAV